MTIVTDETFEEEVLKSDKPVLIDFYADWCGPCKMLSPVIAEIADEHPEIKVCKVNVDENSQVAISLKVMSIPALFVFKDGKPVASSVGFIPKAQVLDLINNA